jgi:hypothetical protein
VRPGALDRLGTNVGNVLSSIFNPRGNNRNRVSLGSGAMDGLARGLRGESAPTPGATGGGVRFVNGQVVFTPPRITAQQQGSRGGTTTANRRPTRGVR